MNLVVLSRSEMESFHVERGSAIISIRSPGARDARLRHDPEVPVLRLIFSDATPTEGVRSFARGEPLPKGFEVKLFDDFHASSIFHFVHDARRRQAVRLYIHCLGGISRSTAVGLGLGGMARVPMTHGDIFDPNPHVYSVMHEASRKLGYSHSGDWLARAAA